MPNERTYTSGNLNWMPKNPNTCVGCGDPAVDINEDGLCVDCRIDAEMREKKRDFPTGR